MITNLDENAYKILANIKADMRSRGIRGACLSDAVRELAIKAKAKAKAKAQEKEKEQGEED